MPKLTDKKMDELIIAFQHADLVTIKKILETEETVAFDYTWANLVSVKSKNQLTHLFCVVTNPGYQKAQLFYDIPPYYADEPLIFVIDVAEAKKVINYLIANHTTNLAFFGTKEFGQLCLGTAIGFDNTPLALALIEMSREMRKSKNFWDEEIIDHQAHFLNDFNENAELTLKETSNPILLSIQKGNVPVFFALLQTNKINVHVADRFGLTPLHWAVIMGIPEMIIALINYGAKKDAKANNHKTPLAYLDIDASQLEPNTFLVEDLEIVQANSTKDPEFRQIVAHFNNNTDRFLSIRKEKMNDEVKGLIQLSLSEPSSRSFLTI